MKKILSYVLVATLFSSCEKEIVSVAEDLIVQTLIKGQWVVTRFTQNANDITSSFSTYKFQYYSNKKVDAIKNGVKERTGNWGGSTTTMTTWADFSGATNPVSLINGTWDIIDAGLDYLEARQTNGTEIKILRLEKR